jgi:hypothetical protein
LLARVDDQSSDDPAGDIARGDKAADVLWRSNPRIRGRTWRRGGVFFAKREWGPAIAQNEAAIADDRNNASAYAHVSF